MVGEESQQPSWSVMWCSLRGPNPGPFFVRDVSTTMKEEVLQKGLGERVVGREGGACVSRKIDLEDCQVR